MPTTAQLRDRLINKLQELFQLDQPDLDFGFYKIMHAKAEQVTAFIERDLLKIIEAAFGQVDQQKLAALQTEYQQAIQLAKNFGAPNPEETDGVQAIKTKIVALQDSGTVEADIYDQLYRFFSRYYDNGDFISQRYYARETAGKAAPYAIPYGGEEVKLHWANADQFYIKTAEYFNRYTVNLREAVEVKANQGSLPLALDEKPLKVTFAIGSGSEGEHGNVKAGDNTKRFFLIDESNPVELTESGELFINFVYRADPEKSGTEGTWRSLRNQESCDRVLAELEGLAESPLNPPILGDLQTEILLENQQSASNIPPKVGGLGGLKELYQEFLAVLKIPAPTDKDKSRPLLAKYINQYTARNTMDYFIHKDLGSFLRRELDFYIKNEVMRLDDIENADVPTVESYLGKIKVLRQISHQLIDFLAQLEDFQKKLWLKKKFVTETNYCITLDRISEDFYAEIAANESQRLEWVSLFAIAEIKASDGDLLSAGTVGYSEPLTVEFLQQNRFLVLDTRFFSEDFKARLLATFEDLDDQCDGLLIHSENFQASNLIFSKYNSSISCLYCDPPYNTGTDGFIYKDSFQHSSWLAMMHNKLPFFQNFVEKDGVIFLSLDDNELHTGLLLMELFFSQGKHLATFARRTKSGGGSATDAFAIEHDYIIAWSNSEKCRKFFINFDQDYLRRYSEEDSVGKFFWDTMERGSTATKPYLIEAPDGTKLKGKWFRSEERFLDDLKTGDARIIKLKNNKWSVQFKQRLSDGKKLRSLMYENDYKSEPKDLEEIGLGEIFSYPKPVFLLKRLIESATFFDRDNAIVADYFAGSGTTGHAVINLNREDNGNRKYILVEMGDYFDTVLKPRIAKVIYSQNWKDGKPTERNSGISHCFKYIRLESYEDTLNNLRLDHNSQRDKTLQKNNEFRQDYMLHYWLEIETRGSQSLLNIDNFAQPNAYKLNLKIPGSDQYQQQTIDLIETFNYLIGLRVKQIDAPQRFNAQFKREIDPELPENQQTKLILDGKLQSAPNGQYWFRKIEGTVPQNPYDPNNGLTENVLIVWRNLTDDLEKDNTLLEQWFLKNRINPKDFEYDIIYVNGSNTLPNLKKDDEHWKVRLIEETFHQKMWDMGGF
jgi:adenine-specific DNA-methyltransferase